MRLTQKQQEKQKKATNDSFDRIIKEPTTDKKTIIDFPDIHKYVSNRFKSIDVSDIPIYIVDVDIMEKEGLSSCGGCYFNKMILIKNRIKSPKSSNKFYEVLNSLMTKEINMEDIVVHEMLHAVSDKFRYNKDFRFAEEEFVYTNCIDFYKSKGYSDDKIIKETFLPFFVQDVLSTETDMSKVISCVKGKNPLNSKMNTEEELKFYDTNAEILSSLIIEKAKIKAKNMMDLYRKYGHRNICSSKNTRNVRDRISNLFEE